MQKLARSLSTLIRNNSALAWSVFFIFLAFFELNPGGLNPNTRWGTLETMLRSHSFNIDDYLGVTMDWTIGPDGHHYSNKAPGPVFLAYPFAWVMHRIWAGSWTLEPGFHLPTNFYKALMCLILQIIPFLLLTLGMVKYMEKKGLSRSSIQFATLAILFGNTAAVVMNSFYGHGLAAWLLMGLFLALVTGRHFWAGACFGFAMLSDYGVIFLFPAFLASLALQNTAPSLPKRLGQVALGGVIPGILWIWYHTACFGSPFALPQMYQNPGFVDLEPQNKLRLFGAFDLIPPLGIVRELLWGPSRGVWTTQPWVLLTALGGAIAAAIPAIRRKIPQELLWFSVLGFLGLLWMNAGFNGWHGGGSPGPRYLSILFPLMGILSAWIYEASPKWIRAGLWLALGVSILLRVMIYMDHMEVPHGHAMWPHFIGIALAFKFRPWMKALIFAGGLIGIGTYQWRANLRSSSQRTY